MVTSVPLSLQRDWDLLAKMPREVMYTEAVEQKRRALWGGILAVLAFICSIGHWNTFPRVNMEALPYTFGLIGVFIFVAPMLLFCQEAALRDQYRFLESGIPYIATVIRRSSPGDVCSSIHQVVYCFVMPDQVATGALTVSPERYEKLTLDTPLIVLVDPYDSYRFVVYDSLSDVALKP